MSTTIDERVVEMRFDNKRFESNVQTSLSTIDKLKKSLNMDGAAKSFENIDNAAKKINMNGLGSAVETVKLKFSALEVMAVTALANITNSVINTGKQLVSSFTIAPIRSGFQEYETQINSVQTILANTEHEGTNLQQVNRALDELNTYADKTIYNFTEMTRNIGTFTAAGVDLRTSVDSIKGIANLAAVSGSTSQQASTAMYQLSQALAAGKISLMDWNSVVNAGMGGKVFQDALVRTSELLGTGAQKAIEANGSFRESLTKGEWLTTEVLTETLKQFAGAYNEADLIQQGFSKEQAKSIAQMAKTAENAATKVKTFTQLWDTLQESAQSGWTQTWEILVGDFGEAKELLTEISDVVGNVISKSAEARNELLSGGLSSGWKQLLDKGIADEAGYIDAIQEVARKNGDAFDKMVADSESFGDALKKGLKDGVISSETFSQAVYNLQDKMSGMSEEELKSAGYTREMVEQIEKLDSGLRDGSISMDEFTEKILRPSGRENLIQALWNAAKGLMSVITPIKEAFRDIFPPLTAQQLYDFTEGLRKLTERFTLSEKASKNLKSTFRGLFAVVDIVGKAFSAVFKAVASLFSGADKLGGSILGVTGSFGEWLVKLNETIEKTDIFNKVLSKIVGFIKATATAIKNFIAAIAKKFKMPGFELFHNILEKVQTRMAQVGEAAGSLKNGVVIAFDEASKALTNCNFLKTLQSIWNVIKTVAGKISHYVKSLFDGLSLDNVISALKGVSIGAITASIVKLVNSIRNIFKSVDGIEKSFIGILDSIKDCFKAYQSEIKANVLMKIAKAIGVIAISIIALSLIDGAKLKNAVQAIAGIYIGLGALFVIFNAIEKNIAELYTISSSIVKIAASIAILAIAIKIIGSMDVNEVKTGGIAVAGLIGVLVLASRLMKSESKDMSTNGKQLIKMATAISILAAAVSALGKMKLLDLAKGVGAISVIMIAFSKFAEEVDDKKHIVRASAAILVLASAIGVLGLSCKAFNTEDIPNVLIALTSIGVLLAELTIALNHMSEKSLANSKGILVAAASMLVLAPAIAILGNLKVTTICKGLLAMASALAVLGISGKVLSPVIPAILNLGKSMMLVSASIFVLGAGLTLIGIGLTTVAAGFGALAVAGAAGATAVVAALSIIIVGIAELIPFIASKIGEGIIALINAIKNEKKAMIEAFSEILLTLLEAGERCIPRLAEGVLGIVESVLKSLVEHTPSIVDSIFNFIIKIIEGIAKNVPRIIKVAMGIFTSFFSGVVNALNSMDTESLLQGTACIGILTAVVIALGALASLIPGAMVGVLGMGAVIAELALVLAAVGALAQIPGLEWLIGEGGDLLQGIGTAIGKFVGGIAGGFMSGVSSQFPQIGSDLSAFMTNVQPFIEGASNIEPSMMEGVKALAETILVLTAANILDGLTSWLTGGSSLSGFAEELIPFGRAMMQFSKEIMGIDSEVVAKAAIAGKTLAEMADTIPKSGGLLGFLAGENNIDDFGKKLVPFGEGLKEFAATVEGIEADDIQRAATTGKMLTEMADTIPKSGGLFGFLAGENNIDDFGKKLVPFGEGLKEFAATVEGIEADDIQKAATAGKTLTELEDTIPNCGGLLGFLAGENNIDDFGKKLVPFGEAITEYSLAVTDLKTDAIQNSVGAAKSLVEIGNSLKNSGGVISWFTGDNNLDTFGEQLASFGQSFAEYYNSVSNIEASQLNGVTAEFQNLVNLANGVKNVDTSGMSSFAQNLTKLGNAGIDGFINAFTNANSRVSTAANNMITTFINGVKIQNGALTIVFTTMVNSIVTAFTSQYHQFTTVGSSIMTKFIAGVRIKDPTLRNTFVTIISGCLTSIRNKFYEFDSVGQSLASNIITGIRNKYNEFYDTGKYLVEGFARGIDEYTWYAESKAREMARAASIAAKKELEEKSPSKVGYRIGRFFGMGFVNSIIDYTDESYKAGTTMASSAKEGLYKAVSSISDFIDGNIDSQPTIRPVLDLSSVQSEAGKLSAILSRSQAMKISTAIAHDTSRTVQNDDNAPTIGNNYSFTQNNYSPKALSKVEIYRQTKNQFSAMKRMVNT